MKPSKLTFIIAAILAAASVQANTRTPGPTPPGDGGIPIVLKLTSKTTVTTPAITQIGPAWGNTAVEFQQSFPAVILAALEQNPNLNVTFQGLPDQELAHLTTELALNDHAGYTAQILAVLLKQLSAPQIARLASAFGAGPVDAQLFNAPVSVQGAYWKITPETPIVYSQSWYARNKVAHMPSQPAYDIYLDFRLQSAGVTQLQAINKTHVLYKSKGLAEVGIVIGIVTGIITIAEHIDPSIRQDIINLSKAAWQDLQNSIPSIPTVVMPSPEMSCPGCGIQSPGEPDTGGGNGQNVQDNDYGVCNEDEGNC